jgi:flagellar biosynthesis/type III secretory pathway M-ring protein FliF/YscJ
MKKINKNKILFLVVYNSYEKNIWYFGKIFMKKYPFVFDYDKKTISFVNIYNINKSDNDKNHEPEKGEEAYTFWDYFKIFIIIILIVLGIIIGVVIGRLLWYKNRKKRANELDDDYEYSNSKMNNKNEILNQNKENKNINEGLFNE